MFIYQRYFNLLIRLIILGIVVFIAASVVPTTPLPIQGRLLIALLVVVTYSLFDLLGYTIYTMKDTLCEAIC